MSAPKWWYYFLAVCIALLTVSASYRLVTSREKWQHISDRQEDDGIFNTSTGETCWQLQYEVDCMHFDDARVSARALRVDRDAKLRGRLRQSPDSAAMDTGYSR